MASTVGYKSPPSQMRCNSCDREGRHGEHQGDTCGDFLPQTFTPKTDAEMGIDIARFRVGLPSKDLISERCLGTLLYPTWID